MFATLQMYDFPEVRAATDAWWAAIARQAGVSLPLSRPTTTWGPGGATISSSPKTCGYPFTHQFRGVLTLVGTPHYAVPGCDGYRYCSFIFAREPRAPASYRGVRAAVNTPDSMSGMLALKSFLLATRATAAS